MMDPSDFEELSPQPADQREVFEIDKNVDTTSEYIRKLQADIVKLQKEKSDSQERFHEMEGRYEQLQQYWKETCEDNEEVIKQIEDISNEKAQREKELVHVRARVEHLLEEKVKCQDEMLKAVSLSSEAAARIASLETKLEFVTKERDELKKQTEAAPQQATIKILGLQAKLDIISKENAQLKEKLDTLQPNPQSVALHGPQDLVHQIQLAFAQLIHEKQVLAEKLEASQSKLRDVENVQALPAPEASSLAMQVDELQQALNESRKVNEELLSKLYHAGEVQTKFESLLEENASHIQDVEKKARGFQQTIQATQVALDESRKENEALLSKLHHAGEVQAKFESLLEENASLVSRVQHVENESDDFRKSLDAIQMALDESQKMNQFLMEENASLVSHVQCIEKQAEDSKQIVQDTRTALDESRKENEALLAKLQQDQLEGEMQTKVESLLEENASLISHVQHFKKEIHGLQQSIQATQIALDESRKENEQLVAKIQTNQDNTVSLQKEINVLRQQRQKGLCNLQAAKDNLLILQNQLKPSGPLVKQIKNLKRKQDAARIQEEEKTDKDMELKVLEDRLEKEYLPLVEEIEALKQECIERHEELQAQKRAIVNLEEQLARLKLEKAQPTEEKTPEVAKGQGMEIDRKVAAFRMRVKALTKQKEEALQQVEMLQQQHERDQEKLDAQASHIGRDKELFEVMALAQKSAEEKLIEACKRLEELLEVSGELENGGVVQVVKEIVTNVQEAVAGIAQVQCDLATVEESQGSCDCRARFKKLRAMVQAVFKGKKVLLDLPPEVRPTKKLRELQTNNNHSSILRNPSLWNKAVLDAIILHHL